MKIAVICANGKAGKLIVQEAVNRGLDVTAVVRSDNTTAAQKVLKKDLFDLTAAMDGRYPSAAQYLFEASVRHSLRHRHPSACRRRRRKSVCESGTYHVCG